MAWGQLELEPEVEDWLLSLPDSQFAHAAFQIDLLGDHGVFLGEPHTRQLEGRLRELRFDLESGAWRITYFMEGNRRIILLTVFRKTRARERRQIQRAMRAMVRCIDANHTPEDDDDGT